MMLFSLPSAQSIATVLHRVGIHFNEFAFQERIILFGPISHFCPLSPLFPFFTFLLPIDIWSIFGYPLFDCSLININSYYLLFIESFFSVFLPFSPIECQRYVETEWEGLGRFRSNDGRFFFFFEGYGCKPGKIGGKVFDKFAGCSQRLRFRVVQSVIFLYIEIWLASNFGNILITETSREVLITIHKWCRLKCYLYLHKCEFKPQEDGLKRIEAMLLTAKYSCCACVIYQKSQQKFQYIIIAI